MPKDLLISTVTERYNKMARHIQRRYDQPLWSQEEQEAMSALAARIKAREITVAAATKEYRETFAFRRRDIVYGRLMNSLKPKKPHLYWYTHEEEKALKEFAVAIMEKRITERGAARLFHETYPHCTASNAKKNLRLLQGKRRYV